MTGVFADVILPLALEKNYTYSIPDEMIAAVKPGIRVEVPFRNKQYTGIVARVHNIRPEGYSPKSLLSLPDHLEVVNKWQLELWNWMTSYYMCTQGDVMQAALPAPYKLSSETIVVFNAQHGVDLLTLEEKEYVVAEALSMQQTLTLKEIQQILGQKSVQPVIRALIGSGIAFIREELKEGYVPKMQKYILLEDQYRSEEALQKLFETLQKHEKQVNLLMMYYQMSERENKVPKTALLRRSGVSPNVLKTMIRNGIFMETEIAVSRLGDLQSAGPAVDELYILNDTQHRALSEIRTQMQTKDVVLLHGVTGSGKTEVYIELIKDAVDAGKQVLYLLPEIALTAQIISRLKKRFGDAVGVYHSKFNHNEKVEIWQQVLRQECKIMLGARSAVFLPFVSLGLVIVDEEHDQSYKQYEPDPRYHGRDTAIYLAHLHQAKTILGSATPSVETYFHASEGKFGLVAMDKRHGDIAMPEVKIIDIKKDQAGEGMQGHFSQELIAEIKRSLEQKEQVILFQNRRGYAPYLICEACGWSPDCINCDVKLVYHKFANELRCHYCNYAVSTYTQCPACASTRVVVKGFGTERIEDDLQYMFPEARNARLDLDSVRTRHGHEKIVQAFETGEIDILTGTQMVTKGLDFDHVRLVGILSADQLLNFADFRATERAFQMLTQVSGRAGRKNKRGLVLVQALRTDKPVLQYVVAHDYHGFYAHEIAERRQFAYPPFTRLIRITFRHRDKQMVSAAATWFAAGLRANLGAMVLGPALPGVPRIRNKFLEEILLKYPNERKSSGMVKQVLRHQIGMQGQHAVHKKVEILLDVDPM